VRPGIRRTEVAVQPEGRLTVRMLAAELIVTKASLLLKLPI
jgi:hypothetical protein